MTNEEHMNLGGWDAPQGHAAVPQEHNEKCPAQPLSDEQQHILDDIPLCDNVNEFIQKLYR